MFDSLQKIKKDWWIYGIAVLFILVNGFLIYKEQFLFSALPLVLLVVVAAFLTLDVLLLGIVFCVPLSVPLSELVSGLPIDMFLPTEPLLAGILLMFFLKLFLNNRYDKRIFRHPVSIAIYAYLGWLLLTSLTSTMPAVSIKQFLSRLWFIVAFYFLSAELFKDEKKAKQYMLLYIYGLSIVICYALFRHVKYGIFDEKIAHWSANPFYKDHTSYGALIAWYLPPIISLALYKDYSPRKKAVYGAFATLLFIGLVTSYSRAAWVSLIGAFCLWALIKLKIKFSVVASGILVFAALFFVFGDDIQRGLQKNSQESSTNLSDHVRSISNVSSDASNLERLNRWNCAIRMFQEKPLFGWGPGTYMFKYGPFQVSHEKTIISTRRGDMGNAHSEYLGPMAEQGFMGMVFYVVIIILTMITGIRAIKNTHHKEMKMLGMAALLGLFTYYLHGFLNNFLDTDKASAPFWGFTALLVVMDLYYSDNDSKSKQEKPSPSIEA